jgi:hypothetical protein
MTAEGTAKHIIHRKAKVAETVNMDGAFELERA